MSDDLVKQWDEYVESMGCVMGEVEHMAQKMRNRIEELEAKLAEEIRISNLRGSMIELELLPNLHDTQAKLEKVVEHFKKLRRRQYSLETFDAVVNEIVEAALAELTGGNDE